VRINFVPSNALFIARNLICFPQTFIGTRKFGFVFFLPNLTPFTLTFQSTGISLWPDCCYVRMSRHIAVLLKI